MANEELIARIRKRADALQNGQRGNTEFMSEQLADLSIVIIDLHNNGCGHRCSTFNYAAALATIVSISAICGTALKLFG